MQVVYGIDSYQLNCHPNICSCFSPVPSSFSLIDNFLPQYSLYFTADWLKGRRLHSENFQWPQQLNVAQTSWAVCRFPINYTPISTMAAEVCLRIVSVIASNAGKQSVRMQTPRRGGERHITLSLPWKLESHFMHRSSWGVNGPAWAGDISAANQGGAVVLLFDKPIVWSRCSYGQGRVINTSAKQQAVWPICFLLGGKRKQWGGVLHTAGDWHYLQEQSMQAFLPHCYSARAAWGDFTSLSRRFICSLICCVTLSDCLLFNCLTEHISA